MSKVSGSYPTVILGVSEQVPQDRRPGQHFEQVNMLSDPVRGLVRRPGSVNLAETEWFSGGLVNSNTRDSEQFRTFEFAVGGTEYTLVYRTKERPAGSNVPMLACYNKTARTFIPVTAGTGALMNALRDGGVSAIVNVGRYLFLAGNTIIPTGTARDAHYSAPNSQKGIIWVRGGQYSRTFSATVSTFLADGTRVAYTAEYTTPSSSYPGVLDTSDIPPGDDYQRLVNDRTNAYNTAVTQWIGTAAAAIQPARIAQELVDAFKANHPEVANAFHRVGSNVAISFDAPGLPNPSIGLEDISVSDGGDGTLMRGVGQVVASPDELSPVHHNGKIVEVRPRNTASESYYMQAHVKTMGVGIGEVTWREAAGETYDIDRVFAFATVENGQFCIGGGPGELGALTGLTVPGFSPRRVGDGASAPAPTFIGNPIHYLGLFQDRLVIGTGSTLFFSRTGDYLNWFRKSVLTVPDDDPIEVYALGAEDDTIRSDVVYDRNLVLFGQQRQYVINGKQPFTPTNASIVSASSYDDPTEARPVASGNFAFYAQRHGPASSLHQIQTGVVVDAPESQELTKNIDTYLRGYPVELVAMTSPNTVVLRTTARNDLYVYSYMDNESQAQRLYESWSRWTWHPVLGMCVGIAPGEKSVLVFTVRQGRNVDDTANAYWLACDEFSLRAEAEDRPHLDSQRPYPELALSVKWLRPHLPLSIRAYMRAAFQATNGEDNSAYMLGDYMDAATTLLDENPQAAPGDLLVGAEQEAFVDPTNPYARDQNDRAIVNGRLTITRLLVSVANTGGVDAWVQSLKGEPKLVAHFNGRVVGDADTRVSYQPIVSTALSVPVGREVRDFRYRLQAITWLPLTVTAIEWVGQLFLNTRRV